MQETKFININYTITTDDGELSSLCDALSAYEDKLTNSVFLNVNSTPGFNPDTNESYRASWTINFTVMEQSE